ncbi:MAG: hypothetical protein A3H27_07540 [Acidobacteria bacterium RIFCSPLOWO2_02_FULL_59_13]|nr:MAG: hypothetical protein A3H27_07540 [Acidobacteria bacterium RIFCSPLOWO2_02_FULL_59_13]
MRLRKLGQEFLLVSAGLTDDGDCDKVYHQEHGDEADNTPQTLTDLRWDRTPKKSQANRLWLVWREV